jgi:ribosomal-protein-alanine N-acetyltransferase
VHFRIAVFPVGSRMDVTIAPASIADGPALIEANRAARAYHAPWAAPFTDQAGFERWFAETLTGPTVRLVARCEAGLVGSFGLSGIVLGAYRGAFLGYHGYPRTGGRGLMTVALGLALDHAFGAMGLHRVEANIQPGNERSRRLAARVGFRLEGFSPRYLRIDGEWRDHERWALLAEEWAEHDLRRMRATPPRP